MDSITVVVTLPDSRLSGHANGGWREKSKLTKRFRQEAYLMAIKAGVPDKPWTKATINYAFFVDSNRRTDEGNLVHRAKAAVDGAVQAGIVADDCWQVLHTAGISVTIDKTNPRVELTFRRV